MERGDWIDTSTCCNRAAPRCGDADIWWFALLPGDGDEALLDAGERRRAARFVRGVDRMRYVAAHAWTRRILATYIDAAAAALRFVPDGAGKPRLEGGRLHFNLSHSAGYALIAVCADRELGVDIEAWREVDEALADAVLAPGERAELARGGLDAPRLLQCWTHKEAFLKALGCGLHRDPRSVDVGLGAARRRMVDGVEMRALPLPAGYSGALAVVGGCRSVRLLQLHGGRH